MFQGFFPFFPHTCGPAVANWTNQLLLLKRREKQHKISISLDLPVNLNGFYIPTICYAYPLYMCLSAPHDKPCIHDAFRFNCTLFENENEWQKTEPVSISLPRASRNFPNVKARFFFFSFYNCVWCVIYKKNQ